MKHLKVTISAAIIISAMLFVAWPAHGQTPNWATEQLPDCVVGVAQNYSPEIAEINALDSAMTTLKQDSNDPYVTKHSAVLVTGRTYAAYTEVCSANHKPVNKEL